MSVKVCHKQMKEREREKKRCDACWVSGDANIMTISRPLVQLMMVDTSCGFYVHALDKPFAAENNLMIVMPLFR